MIQYEKLEYKHNDFFKNNVCIGIFSTNERNSQNLFPLNIPIWNLKILMWNFSFLGSEIFLSVIYEPLRNLDFENISYLEG